jgi:hypothetical protein
VAAASAVFEVDPAPLRQQTRHSMFLILAVPVIAAGDLQLLGAIQFNGV